MSPSITYMYVFPAAREETSVDFSFTQNYWNQKIFEGDKGSCSHKRNLNQPQLLLRFLAHSTQGNKKEIILFTVYVHQII